VSFELSKPTTGTVTDVRGRSIGTEDLSLPVANQIGRSMPFATARCRRQVHTLPAPVRHPLRSSANADGANSRFHRALVGSSPSQDVQGHDEGSKQDARISVAAKEDPLAR
jgi:hypothetical protein